MKRDEGGVESGMAWDLNGGFEREIGWRITGMVGCEGYMCMAPIHVGRTVGECRERMGLLAWLGGWRTCWGRNERWEMGTWV